MKKSNKSDTKRSTRSLDDSDIVTRGRIDRRSALARIARGVAFGSALTVAPGMTRAQVADRTDVSRVGDPIADADSGAGADPSADTDITVSADAGNAGFDDDITTVGDLADEDVGALADRGDTDRPVIADRKTSGLSDTADIDITQRGDPIPTIDVDPSDPGGDADLSSAGDTADQD
jgi:hypothetical protein